MSITSTFTVRPLIFPASACCALLTLFADPTSLPVDFRRFWSINAVEPGLNFRPGAVRGYGIPVADLRNGTWVKDADGVFGKGRCGEVKKGRLGLETKNDACIALYVDLSYILWYKCTNLFH